MQYTTLGKTGMTVSRICLGCLGFGNEDDWRGDKDESEEILERAIDAGINFFDTANNYSNGESEHILADVPGKVRLVEGAYDPPAGEGVRRAEAVNAAFEDRLERLFTTRDGPEQGVAVGTHDPRLTEVARSLSDARPGDGMKA